MSAARSLLVGIAVLLASAAACAGGSPIAPTAVADGVLVVGGPHDATTLAVELDGGVLLVDPSAAQTEALPEDARWRVETGAPGRSAATAPSASHLVPGDGPASGGVRFRDRLELGDDAVVLALGRGATASDVAVWLPGRGVLAVGALAGDLSKVDPGADTRAWIASLERLERLGAEVVVPARGAAGGPELLRDRRARLERLRSAVWDDILARHDRDQILRLHGDAAPTALVGHVYEELSGVVPPRELLEERGLQEGPSPTRDDPGWTPPRKVVWRNLWPDRLPALAAVAPGVEIVPVSSADEALAAVPGADAVIGVLDADIAAAGDALRWAQVPSAGVERYVGIPELAEHGIVLTNGQRLASPEIAEHAMALARALARRLDRALAAQADGEWARAEYREGDDLLRLRGKTLLVAGLGGIGTEVARLADAAGMTVLATRNSSRSGPAFVAEVGLAGDLDELLARADVVVNCLPLTDSTRGLFDRDTFRRMPGHALFVNVGRGGTVVTSDLVAALEAGEIGGAGLDVTDPEPLPEGHPLWSAPNVVITPHSAAISDAGWERLWLLFRENLRRFAAGEPLLSVVDLERGY